MTKDNWIKAFDEEMPFFVTEIGIDHPPINRKFIDQIKSFISQVEKDAIEKKNKRWRERIKEKQSDVATSIAHHETDIEYWEDNRKDVFKTKRECQSFLNALYQFEEMLSDLLEDKK